MEKNNITIEGNDVIQQKRPCNPDCVIFSKAKRNLAITSYYRQLEGPKWVGGVGIHKFQEETKNENPGGFGLKETGFYFNKGPGIFDCKLIEKEETTTSETHQNLIAVTVEKSLILYNLNENLDNPSEKLSIEIKERETHTLEESAVHVSLNDDRDHSDTSQHSNKHLVSTVHENGHQKLFHLTDEHGFAPLWSMKEDKYTIWCSLIDEKSGVVYAGNDEGYFCSRDLSSGKLIQKTRQ